MTAEQVEDFDKALAELLASRFAAALLQVPHRVFAVLARAPERAARQGDEAAEPQPARDRPVVAWHPTRVLRASLEALWLATEAPVRWAGGGGHPRGFVGRIC